jgi:arginine deiminase
MHLDMILTQVSRNIFTFHQPLNNKIEIFHLQHNCQWISFGNDLPKALTLLLNKSLFFYDSIDEITSIDEQSHCRHNVFALCECHVITYDGDIDPIRSIYTQMINHMQHPCRVGLIRAKGLVDGGGGTHCITNAIARRKID